MSHPAGCILLIYIVTIGSVGPLGAFEYGRKAPNHPRSKARKGNTSHAAISARRKPLGGSVDRRLQRNRVRPRHEITERIFQFPEDWHEPTGKRTSSYRIIIQDPGPGYAHVVTPKQIRARLAQLPPHFLDLLDVVQLSRMTYKKQRSPCYGMQYGGTIYLYPLECDLVEPFDRPPRPAEYNEARMFGGKWVGGSGPNWRLIWTPAAAQDFYLNSVLIHELGHLLDDHNSSFRDRERYADSFAIEYGYKPTRRRSRKRRR